jgi:purine-binding chemotaxis protein CheW
MRMNGETTLSTIPKPVKAAKAEQKTDRTLADWSEVQQKMLASDAKLVWMDDVPQDILEGIWARRAEEVAQALEDGERGEQVQIAVVRMGREAYGFETDYIFDIRTVDHITRVPRVPDWVAGIVNLRGRIISVLDLQRFLNLRSAEKEGEIETRSQHLVVVGIPTMELAMLVDEVVEIKSLPVSHIQEASGSVRTIQAEYIRGIVSIEEGNPNEVERSLVLILDLPILLADKRLIVHEDII